MIDEHAYLVHNFMSYASMRLMVSVTPWCMLPGVDYLGLIPLHFVLSQFPCTVLLYQTFLHVSLTLIIY